MKQAQRLLIVLLLLATTGTQAQNVGIGTPAPLKALHVQQGGTSLLTSAFGNGMIFSTNSASGARVFLENLNGASGQKTLVLANENIGGQGTAYFGSLSDNGGAWVNSSILSMNLSSGNVGIGTPNPANKLSVSGNVDITGNLGIGTPTAAASAQLDVSSTTKGFLPPRMTYDQRNLVASPAAGLILWCSNCGTAGELQFYNGSSWNALAAVAPLTPFPILTTTNLSSVWSTSAVSGGNITGQGNTPVTARGVCWSTSPNPTVALPTKTTDGTGTGIFVSNITGLTIGTTYYVRAYATNSFGTSYGNELSFTANYGIGETAFGGKIAYIFQPGDPGYIAGQTHGLVAAPSNQSTGAPWGCSGTFIAGTSGAFGAGNQNTINIMAGCATAGIAARICGTLVLGGFSDWYLPSSAELQILYNNRVAIGGFANGIYWTSLDEGVNPTYNIAGHLDFSNGVTYFSTKSASNRVRAIRSF